MTRGERIQWIVVGGLVALILGMLVWHMFFPDEGESGRIPVIDEVLRRREL